MNSIYKYIKQKQSQNNLLKHEQIVEGVMQAIQHHAVVKGDFLPSVNQAVEEFGIARKTVVKAYDVLKQRGIIRAKKRLGYYIVDTNIKIQQKIMLLLNHFSAYQQSIYESILDKSSENSDQIDLYFHHTNEKMFESIIKANVGQYTHYIVSPFYDERAAYALSLIPKDKLLLVSRPDYHQGYGSYVVQNYTSELLKALSNAVSDIIKYKSLTLLLSVTNKAPIELEKTVETFCQSEGLQFIVSRKFSFSLIEKGRAYFIIEDNDLLSFLLACKEQNILPGKDIGLLSYNDSPMKQLIGTGISTVSVDFFKMGEYINQWLFDDADVKVVLPVIYHKRNSL